MPQATPDRDEDKRLVTDKVQIRDFPGYTPNADPHDIPPGASPHQVNVAPVIPGQLTVRHGYARVTFSS